LHFSSSSVCRIPLITFYSAGLLVMNCFSFIVESFLFCFCVCMFFYHWKILLLTELWRTAFLHTVISGDTYFLSEGIIPCFPCLYSLSWDILSSDLYTPICTCHLSLETFNISLLSMSNDVPIIFFGRFFSNLVESCSNLVEWVIEINSNLVEWVIEKKIRGKTELIGK
jgi:hypothetical protein